MASNKLLLNLVAIFSFLSLLSTLTRGCQLCQTDTTSLAVTPSPAPAPAAGSCSMDTLKLGVCVDLLGLVKLALGTPPSSSCCALLEGLADLEAAICLCNAMKDKGVNLDAPMSPLPLDVPIALSLLISACNKTVPPGFTCA